MATNTTNYNFKKPDESDFYSVQDQNNNWDKADAALKDLDTPTFEDYSGSTTVPDAATAINNIKSKGKLSTIVSNVKAAFKGACLIGQIVNNCVTNNAKLPLSAAQGKALMDLYTQLNSDLANKLDSSAIIAQYNKLQIGNVKIQYGKMECIVNFNGQASIVFPEGYSQENLYHCMAVPMSGSYAVRSITNSGNNNSLALLLDSSDTKPEYQSKIWMQYIVIGT
ncbi:hypothetical protein [Hungatella hathewayi]|uniref:hypothetical protein n=2 Tax=Lachnospiraceae TaxID=186803 RepID=UPI0035675E71